MSSIDLATRFKIRMYLLNWKSVTNAFPRWKDIKQVLNELPTNKRPIKVPQDRLLCPTHVDNKNKQVFKKILLRCVTRPDLSGVPLTIPVWISWLPVYGRSANETINDHGLRNHGCCPSHLEVSRVFWEDRQQCQHHQSHTSLQASLTHTPIIGNPRTVAWLRSLAGLHVLCVLCFVSICFCNHCFFSLSVLSSKRHWLYSDKGKGHLGNVRWGQLICKLPKIVWLFCKLTAQKFCWIFFYHIWSISKFILLFIRWKIKAMCFVVGWCSELLSHLNWLKKHHNYCNWSLHLHENTWWLRIDVIFYKFEM